MNLTQIKRRRFLADASRVAAAGWLALETPWLASLAGCARGDAHDDGTFSTLTPREARTMRAFAAQILPSDGDTPGAEEAGAVYFVDRALGRPFYADRVKVVRAGLADLDARAHAMRSRAEFASLAPAHQVAIMRQIEHEPFFAIARELVIVGTFAEPSYGGNRAGAGWAIAGIEHRPSYAAPFGWYDAAEAAEAHRS